MGRRASGWHLSFDQGAWQVRWTADGKRTQRSTGCRDRRDREAAEKAAREIYATQVRKGGDGKQRRAVSQSEVLACVVRWVRSLPFRGITRKRYQQYGGCWCKRWVRVSELTDSSIAKYLVEERPRVVTGKAVRNEGSALRRFLRWLVAEEELPEMPAVPELPTSLLGTRYAVRRRTRAPDLSPDEVERLISKLPKYSRRDGWPVQARAIVAHETSLRPTTMEQLRSPEHYSKGQRLIRVTLEIDKEGFARDVPLSARARKALDSVCPAEGLIFGRHRLDPYVRKAAKASKLAPGKAAIFCMQHLRSAALTHMGERPGASLAGIQHMAGHRDPHTASKYFRPSFRAALAVIGEDSGKRISRGRQKPRKSA